MPMGTTPSNDRRPEQLQQKLIGLHAEILDRTCQARALFPFSNRDCECSRDNLLAYLVLRDHDLQDIQLELADLGLSSLGRLESNVLSCFRKVMTHLGVVPAELPYAPPDFAQARALLSQRSRSLLGRPREGRGTRIMVTLDASILQQPNLLEALLVQGMDIARINCAHDSAEEWAHIIHAVRYAEERLTLRGAGVGRQCRIIMDLAGPKVRTGPMLLETRPVKLSVPKDARGRPRRILEGILDSEAAQTCKIRRPGEPPQFVIAVPRQSGIGRLELGEELRFADARGRQRVLRVIERLSPTAQRVSLDRTAYLQEGIELRASDGRTFTVGAVSQQPVDVRIKAGDRLRLYRDPQRPGHPPAGGQPAGISCTLPDALRFVEPGHRVFIDDGKIAAVVTDADEECLHLEVTGPNVPVRLRPEKGLNFPDSALRVPAFTPQDRKDLAFIVKHATAVAMSFINRVEDLHELRAALQELGHPDLGIVLKIETKEAIHHLAQLILAGLDAPKFGIMIARGDLAVEVGFENLSLVQEDILCLCEAAHVPVIWATQVLESLAKSGMAARPEITDAAMGQRAECVMLNKGEHILDAVKTLSELLSSEERHRIKKRQVFRDITAQYGVFPAPAPARAEERKRDSRGVRASGSGTFSSER